MRLVFSIIALAVLTPGALAQTPAIAQPSPTPNPETFDWCKAEPAYDAMLREVEWKKANELYQIMLGVKSRVTPEQHADMRAILLAMAAGPRKSDLELLDMVTDDLAEGVSLRRLTVRQKAGLAINMQFAMHGVNDDYLPNVSTSLAFISNTFNDAGMNTKRARKIVDDVYALVANARGGDGYSTSSDNRRRERRARLNCEFELRI